MRKFSLLSVAFLLAAAVGAFSQDIRYNFDKDADFAKFKTYKWVLIKDAKPVDDITDKQIKAAVEAQLSQKGLTKVDSDDANLYVGYQASVGSEQQLTSYSSGWGYGGGWYGSGWYGPTGATTTTQTNTIYTGQLALDMYDAAHHDLIWRGVVSKSINPNAKPEKRQKNLDKALAKLFKKYPPPPPGK